jgi:non-specific serine/threonine protein kinase
LRALIDWSYDLLTPEERRLFRQLAVFAGGFPLEAAEAVCECKDEDVIDLLGRLVEKSLVLLDPEKGRYRLLETVRQYAQERLNDSGDEHEVRDRHLVFFVELIERAKPQLVGPDQASWLQRLDLERENILSAHPWADLATAGGVLGLRLASAVRRYWISRGLLELGLRVTLESLRRDAAKERTVERSQALFAAGQLQYLMGRYADARKCLEESLEVSRLLGDKRGIAAVLQPLGMAAQGEGDFARAQSFLEEALEAARLRGDKQQIAAAVNTLAQLRFLQGGLDNSEKLFQEVLSLARELGDAEAIAIAHINLAMVSIARGSPELAGEFLAEPFRVSESIRSRLVSKSLLEICAALAATQKAWERAALLYGAAEAQAEETGLRRDPADEAFLAPRIDAARAALGRADFAAREQAGRAISLDEALKEASSGLVTTR